MQPRTRVLAAAGGLLVVAGVIVFAIGDDNVESTAALGERLGIFAVGLGFAALALIPALRFWRRPMPAKAISVAAFALVGLMTLGAIGGIAGSGNGSNRASPTVAPSEAVVDPTATPSPTEAVATLSPSPSASAAPTATPSMSPTPSRTPAPTASATPAPTPVPTASAASNTATLGDPVGDYLDENGEAIKDGPPSTDITSVQVAAANGQIDFAMDIAAVPPAVDTVNHQQAYGFSIETTGDDVPDWQLLVQNVDQKSEQNAPGWVAGIFSYADSFTREGVQFPGTMDFKGTHLHVGLPLDAMGSPTGTVRIIGYTEDIEFPDPVKDPTKTIQRDDKAPDHQWPDGSDWIVVRLP